MAVQPPVHVYTICTVALALAPKKFERWLFGDYAYNLLYLSNLIGATTCRLAKEETILQYGVRFNALI